MEGRRDRTVKRRQEGGRRMRRNEEGSGLNCPENSKENEEERGGRRGRRKERRKEGGTRTTGMGSIKRKRSDGPHQSGYCSHFSCLCTNL
jgi:hypothetical protein